jgi:hypothetical protein
VGFESKLNAGLFFESKVQLVCRGAISLFKTGTTADIKIVLAKITY